MSQVRYWDPTLQIMHHDNNSIDEKKVIELKKLNYTDSRGSEIFEQDNLFVRGAFARACIEDGEEGAWLDYDKGQVFISFPDEIFNRSIVVGSSLESNEGKEDIIL